MSRTQEIANILNRSPSHVLRLLKEGKLKGTRSKKNWIVTDEAVQEYLAQQKIIEQRKFHLEKNQKIGYWTVLDPDPEVNRTRHKKVALCQCICGKIKLVNISTLKNGISQSCGCRRAERMSAEQIKGKETGHKIMNQIHQAGLAAKYIGRKVNKNSHSGHTGVSWMKTINKYRAYIMVSHKQIALGLYENIEDAIAARKAAEKKYFQQLQKKVDTIRTEGKRQ